jgi:hypothetical protein
MSRIEIGKDGAGKPLHLEVEALLRTRALVQANSGGGKSYALRRMAEQLFGKVPVWIVDPEGEFASLRERFGFVLVGKGGETPADPRSAELVVQRLLEHGASAVFDLYDLKPPTRHHFVRVLLDALMNAPKALWKPLVLKLDEAHLFAPEKGMGESEAFGAVQDVATRGRKRGVCLVAYTQRLAKISKNVTAELLNRLVGMTFEGVDVDRAAEVLTVPKDEREAFKREIKSLHPGQFFALGPALAKDRTLLKVGPVQTTHPEPGTTAAAAPPPAPEKIKALLPKLADLPKEAETKAKTEAELKAEVRSLRAQVAQLEKRPTAAPAPAAPKVKPIEVKLLGDREFNRIESAVLAVQNLGKMLGDAGRAMADRLQEILKAEASLMGTVRRAVTTPTAAAPKPAPQLAIVKVHSAHPPGRMILRDSENSEGPAGDITPAQRRILQALADFAGIGRHDVPRTWVAARAGASHRSSSFANNLGALRSKGLIEYAGQGIRATVAGFVICPVAGAPLTTQEMLDSCMRLLVPAQQKILAQAFAAYPRALPKAELAEAAQASPNSSSYANNLGALRSAGMIEYVDGGVKAADWIFVDGRESA